MRFTYLLCPLALLTLYGCSQQVMAADPKIPITPAMVLDESGMTEVGAAGPGQLVDEQADLDPAKGQGKVPTTSWSPGWTKWYYPAHALIDLGRTYHVTKVDVYDGQGAGGITLAGGGPFQWQDLFTDNLTNYLKWNEHAVDVPTRYVRVTLADAGTRVPEIVLYGTPVGAVAPAAPAVTPHTPPTIDEFIGTNAFIDDPLDKIAVGGFEREYHNWDWDEGDRQEYPGYPRNQNRWNPSAAGGGGWNFDDYYARLKHAGVLVCPCIQGNAFWMTGRDPKKFGTKPVVPGADTTDPASYAAHADHMFQFAARYGGVKVHDTLLKLAPGQPRRSGLGLLGYYENWNEQDKWWEGPESWFSPYDFAAMSSADYDGHRGTMGKTFGVKHADPNAKLVMGGIARLSLDYIKAMKLWADTYRNGEFPADVINLHHYSNDGGEQQQGTAGISPEADQLREKLQQFVDYRDRYLPGKAVWLTEFGYDLNPKSPQRAPAIAPYTAEEVQAQWLIRSYLALAAAGVDRAAMFMLRDVNPQDATQFSSSGLVTEKGAWQPKTSWYYVYTMKNRLKGMRYAGKIASGAASVKVYRFKSGTGTGRAYAVWCPTSNGTRVADYELALDGQPAQATLVNLTNGSTEGTASALTIHQGKVTLAVSERPLFVLVR